MGDHAFDSDRDLLLEFVQWCVDNPALSEDVLEDPYAAVVAVDEFLADLGGDP